MYPYLQASYHAALPPYCMYTRLRMNYVIIPVGEGYEVREHNADGTYGRLCDTFIREVDALRYVSAALKGNKPPERPSTSYATWIR